MFSGVDRPCWYSPEKWLVTVKMTTTEVVKRQSTPTRTPRSQDSTNLDDLH